AIAKDEDAIAFARLGVEADVVAQAGAAAAGDAEAQAAGLRRDTLLGHGHANALERILRDLHRSLGARLLAFGGQQHHARERVFARGGRRCGSGLEKCGHRSGFQPLVLLFALTWGFAPGWY